MYYIIDAVAQISNAYNKSVLDTYWPTMKKKGSI